MDYPSFTIEFFEHLLPEDYQYCLNQLRNTGASVEPHRERMFRVVCSRPQELAYVGWMLFHSHFKDLCRKFDIRRRRGPSECIPETKFRVA